MTARPVHRLTLTGALRYNAARYRHLAPTQDLSGRPVVQAPKWNPNLSATYSAPLTETIDGYAGADFNYKSGYYGYIDDSPFSWIKGYTVTNFRLGVKLDHGRYDVSGWVRNAFDSRYFYLITPTATGSAGYVASVAEPRMFGASVKVSL